MQDESEDGVDGVGGFGVVGGSDVVGVGRWVGRGVRGSSLWYRSMSLLLINNYNCLNLSGIA